MSGCPDRDEVEAVLDRCAEPARALAVRDHVAGCERCLDAFGAAFELELWGPQLAPPPRVAVPERRRSLVPLALAAAALLLIGAAAWQWRFGGGATVARPEAGAARSARPALRVVELATSVGTSGPQGSAETTISRRADEPRLLRIAERSIDGAGCVRRHERLAPLDVPMAQ